MKEMDLLNAIRLALQENGVKTFRVNVGTARTQDGRYFNLGLPKGFSDLLCIRQDGRAVFIECKVKPNKPTKEQCNFILAMIEQGCAAGIAFSVDEAKRIVEWNEGFALAMEGKVRDYLTRYK